MRTEWNFAEPQYDSVLPYDQSKTNPHQNTSCQEYPLFFSFLFFHSSLPCYSLNSFKSKRRKKRKMKNNKNSRQTYKYILEVQFTMCSSIPDLQWRKKKTSSIVVQTHLSIRSWGINNLQVCTASFLQLYISLEVHWMDGFLPHCIIITPLREKIFTCPPPSHTFSAIYSGTIASGVRSLQR